MIAPPMNEFHIARGGGNVDEQMSIDNNQSDCMKYVHIPSNHEYTIRYPDFRLNNPRTVSVERTSMWAILMTSYVSFKRLFSQRPSYSE